MSSTDGHPPVYQGGRGSPLVLLHGLTGTWRNWRTVIPALERSHAVLAPTLAGHLGAEPLDAGEAPTVRAMTDAVERQLDRSGLDTAHFAGNSFGALVAMELARRGRARSIVAFAPPAAWTHRTDTELVLLQLRAFQWFARHRHPQIAALVRRPRTRRWALRLVAERGERIAGADVLEMFDASAACDLLEPIAADMMRRGPFPAGPRIDCPVRLVWGETDRVLPARRWGRPLLQRLPGAELVILPGVGHAPMLDDPELVARTILDFTQRAGRGAVWAQPRAGAPAQETSARPRYRHHEPTDPR